MIVFKGGPVDDTNRVPFLRRLGYPQLPKAVFPFRKSTESGTA